MDQTSLHVQRAIRGDEQGAEWVVSHFQPFVAAQVRIHAGGAVSEQDAEDIAGHVWLVTLERIGELEPRDGRYARVLARFLSTTVINTCNNYLRARIRSRRMAESESFELMADTRGVVTRAAENERQTAIDRCLASLPEQSRNVLVLRLMEHRSNQEIAELLELEPNTVAVRYRRALERLRQSLPESVYRDVLDAVR